MKGSTKTGILIAAALAALTPLVVTGSSCSLVQRDPALLVADSTLFIVGVIEASPDTVVHHPQVFVGRLSDPLDRRYDIFADPEANLGRELFLPDLWAQVVIKAGFLSLRLRPDSRARVAVSGPIGRPESRLVSFHHERRGVYGDLQRQLSLVPGGRYRLEVALPDGRRYIAETQAPLPYQIEVPDVVESPSALEVHGPGQFTELGEPVRFLCIPDPDSRAAVSVWSVSRDRVFDALAFLEPSWKNLWFSDRGDHLRGTALFQISTHNEFIPGTGCWTKWGADTNTGRWDFNPLFVRLSQLSPELSVYYESPLREFTTRTLNGNLAYDDPWYTNTLIRRVDANYHRDASYLPAVSNLYAVSEAGAQQKATDAVGVFGAMTSRYLTRTIRPVRSFDPDALTWPYPPRPPTP